jgi:site-specific DNA-cytosine methylase
LSTPSPQLTDLPYIGCQSFAGAFDLGTTQAGFRLVHRVEQKGGFGLFNCDVNRHLLGQHWTMQDGDPSTWVPYRVPLVIGNPPCSGFSTLSPRDFRGMDSKINECMWAFASYAASCYPEVVIFESVQGAFKKGQPLMQALRDKVEALTGRRWFLTHVLHNALSVGGCAMRKRYFWVCSQIPFGIERPEVDRVPSLYSAIGDLVQMPYTYEAQPYNWPTDEPSWWAEPRLHPEGMVDGHQYYDCSYINKSLQLVTPETGPWEEGQRLQQRFQMFYDTHGYLHEAWQTRIKLVKPDCYPGHKHESQCFWCGASQLTRWKWKEPARVITGAGLESVLHPLLDRGLTHREVARIMGFPDTWEIRQFEDQKGSIRQTWGKQIPVDCGRWISSWARRSILGEPGSYTGDPIGDREFLIDVTNDHKGADII